MRVRAAVTRGPSSPARTHPPPPPPTSTRRGRRVVVDPALAYYSNPIGAWLMLYTHRSHLPEKGSYPLSPPLSLSLPLAHTLSSWWDRKVFWRLRSFPAHCRCAHAHTRTRTHTHTHFLQSRRLVRVVLAIFGRIVWAAGGANGPEKLLPAAWRIANDEDYTSTRRISSPRRYYIGAGYGRGGRVVRKESRFHFLFFHHIEVFGGSSRLIAVGPRARHRNSYFHNDILYKVCAAHGNGS